MSIPDVSTRKPREFTLTGIEQLLAFEKGTRTHDDAPDADEGAIYILQKRTRIETFTPRFGTRTTSKNLW